MKMKEEYWANVKVLQVEHLDLRLMLSLLQVGPRFVERSAACFRVVHLQRLNLKEEDRKENVRFKLLNRKKEKRRVRIKEGINQCR